VALLRAVLVETALGWSAVALSPAGIRRSTLFHSSDAEALAGLRRAPDTAFVEPAPAGDPRAAEVAALLRAYSEGDGRALEGVPVDLPAATPLQQRTWLALRTIPCGETRSYGWLAAMVDIPGRARAVGAINAANPCAPWLPCHRVVGADGSLTGYAGGLALKRRLLELEGALPRTLL
jgi:O-6-methylguanine DNA methyltransferase